MKDGSVKSYSLDDFSKMEYTAPLPENPVQIEVLPHHTCATLTVSAPEEGVYYRIAGKTKSELAGIDEDEWIDHIIQADKDYVQSVAEEYGRPLSSFPISQICESGSRVRDWYPDELILDDTPIALVVYTAEVKDDDLNVTTPSKYIAGQIKWYNNVNTIRWAENEYVYMGEKTITTHDGIINGLYLQAEQEYFVLICGITPDGTRTTAIKQIQCITSVEQEKEPVSFAVDFGPRTPSGSIASQTITISPSDKEIKYVLTISRRQTPTPILLSTMRSS